MLLCALLLLVPRQDASSLIVEDGHVSLIATDKSQRLIGLGDFAAWSPDHAQIVLSRADRIVTVDLQGGRERTLWEAGKEEEVTGLTWGPAAAQERTGLGLATTPGSSILVSVENREGNGIYQIIPESRIAPVKLNWLSRAGLNMPDISAPSWSPSGKYLAYTVSGDIWLAVKVEGDSEGAGGWMIRRLVACASYDGGTYYGSHWTTVADRIAWKPDESGFAYHTTRIGGSGEDDVNVVRFNVKDDSPELVSDERISEDSRSFYFSTDGTLHYREGDAWKVR